MARIFCWELMLGLLIVDIAEASTFTTTAKNLRDKELLDPTYDTAVRPDETVNVKAGFSLFTIDSLDTAQQALTVTGWLTLKWNDDRLTWVPSSYGNITEIHLQPSEVWIPEVIIDNSLANIGVINDNNLQLTVTYLGDVIWEPPNLYTTLCAIDVTYYPFDRQTCVIELTTWSMANDQLTLDHLSTYIDTESYKINGEWIIVSTSLKDEDVQDTRPDGVVETSSQLDFILVLDRRPAFYAVNVMLPIILSSFLSCVVFLVPFHAGEKVSYILTIILAIAVLLTLIASSLPHTSLTPSVLGIYLATTMFISVINAVITVLLLNIFHNEDKVEVTSSFYKLTSFVAGILSLKGCKKRCMKGNGITGNKVVPNGTIPADKKNFTELGVDEMDTKSVYASIDIDDGERKVYTWVEIANIWDRLCFWVSFILTCIFTFSFLVALAVGEKYRN